MKSFDKWLGLTLLPVLAGCCALPPTAESLTGVPVIEFGDKAPKTGEFVLHFPAGRPISIVTAVKGTALVQESETTAQVSLKKDVYAYRDWVSFDGKHWQYGQDAMSITADMKIPGIQHPEPGSITIQVDFK